MQSNKYNAVATAAIPAATVKRTAINFQAVTVAGTQVPKHTVIQFVRRRWDSPNWESRSGRQKPATPRATDATAVTHPVPAARAKVTGIRRSRAATKKLRLGKRISAKTNAICANAQLTRTRLSGRRLEPQVTRQGSGIPKSRQILRARKSLISLCRGTAEVFR
jgi:hypothetical protein